METVELARRAAEEAAGYQRHKADDPRYAFALLRRALVDGSEEAFAYFYELYQRQVTAWVHQHPRFEQTGEGAEYFTQAAFTAFYFALRGAKFERFPTLSAALQYLKLCVHTQVALYLRNSQRQRETPLDQEHDRLETVDSDAALAAGDLWSRICELLPNARDQLLARCAFALRLRPSEIRQAYSAYWSSERDISLALYRIRRTLRNDSQILSFVA